MKRDTKIKILNLFSPIQYRIVKLPLGYIEESRLNKFNPLSYFILLFAIPVSIFIDGWKETKRSLKTIFKFK